MAYTDTTSLGYEYGATNIQNWANLDGDGNSTKIANCIAWHIANADAFINDRLRRSNLNFRIPLTDDDSAVHPTVRKVATLIVGYWLSKARGHRDYDDNGNPVTKYWADYREAMSILEQIAEGKLRLEDMP